MAKGYLGPASQQFLSTELHALGVSANTVEPQHIASLAEAVREHAVRLMGADRATELADALARCEGDTARAKAGGGHKLASDAAAKLFASGKLRQAERAYLELVSKHGDRESYIGLARAQAALEDEPAAVETLREGAAKMARAGDRGNAVSLLAEAVALVPLDLSAHRRLAAALANQGDLGGAVEEYARFVDAAMAIGDSRRALLELSYGRETLGDLPRLVALVDRVQSPMAPRMDPISEPRRIDGPVDLRLAALRAPTKSSEFRINMPPAPTSVRAAPPSSAKQPAAPRSQPELTFAQPAPAPVAKAAPQAKAKPTAPTAKAAPAPQPTPVEARPDPRLEALAMQTMTTPEPAPAKAEPAPAKAEPAPAKDASKTRHAASETAVFLKGARTFTHAEPVETEAPVDMLIRTGVVKPKPEARPGVDIEPLLKTLTPTGSGIDAAAMAASRAALLTSARDKRATEAALDAAQRLLALGKLQTASDVLLDLIAHGFADREAQRLLIEVDCALGRRDVAKEKCTLLGHAYRLDGRREVAEDVERLARIL